VSREKVADRQAGKQRLLSAQEQSLTGRKLEAMGREAEGLGKTSKVNQAGRQRQKLRAKAPN
jgi:hypothetical protein